MISWTDEAWQDYLYWQDEDKTLKRINKLIKDIENNANLKGYYSRRIDEINRLVYVATNDEIVIISCRYHYEK